MATAAATKADTKREKLEQDLIELAMKYEGQKIQQTELDGTVKDTRDEIITTMDSLNYTSFDIDDGQKKLLRIIVSDGSRSTLDTEKFLELCAEAGILNKVKTLMKQATKHSAFKTVKPLRVKPGE